MSRVVEPNGSQVLPDRGGTRRTVTGWAAHCAADADHRTCSPAARELAGRLLVERTP